MKKNILFLLVLNILFCSVNAQQYPSDKLVTTDKDKELFCEYMKLFKDKEYDSFSSLITETGKFFLAIPYKGGTLDTEKVEKLVVNFREFDCVTYVESVLALSLTHFEKGNFDTYCFLLQKIRYRNGMQDGYLSRLHYFSEWIYDNQQKGLINDLTAQAGGEKIRFDLNFMSENSALYPMLKGYPERKKKYGKRKIF